MLKITCPHCGSAAYTAQRGDRFTMRDDKCDSSFEVVRVGSRYKVVDPTATEAPVAAKTAKKRKRGK